MLKKYSNQIVKNKRRVKIKQAIYLIISINQRYKIRIQITYKVEKMQERAEKQGDTEFANVFANLAGAHRQVFDFLENLGQKENL